MDAELVFLVTLDGGTEERTLTVPDDEVESISIGEIKKRLEKEFGYETQYQQLSMGGTMLDDDWLGEDFGLQDGTSFQVSVLRPAGSGGSGGGGGAGGGRGGGGGGAGDQEGKGETKKRSGLASLFSRGPKQPAATVATTTTDGASSPPLQHPESGGISGPHTPTNRGGAAAGADAQFHAAINAAAATGPISAQGTPSRGAGPLPGHMTPGRMTPGHLTPSQRAGLAQGASASGRPVGAPGDPVAAAAAALVGDEDVVNVPDQQGFFDEEGKAQDAAGGISTPGMLGDPNMVAAGKPGPDGADGSPRNLAALVAQGLRMQEKMTPPTTAAGGDQPSDGGMAGAGAGDGLPAAGDDGGMTGADGQGGPAAGAGVSGLRAGLKQIAKDFKLQMKPGGGPFTMAQAVQMQMMQQQAATGAGAGAGVMSGGMPGFAAFVAQQQQFAGGGAGLPRGVFGGAGMPGMGQNSSPQREAPPPPKPPMETKVVVKRVLSSNPLTLSFLDRRLLLRRAFDAAMSKTQHTDETGTAPAVDLATLRIGLNSACSDSPGAGPFLLKAFEEVHVMQVHGKTRLQWHEALQTVQSWETRTRTGVTDASGSLMASEMGGEGPDVYVFEPFSLMVSVRVKDEAMTPPREEEKQLLVSAACDPAEQARDICTEMHLPEAALESIQQQLSGVLYRALRDEVKSSCYEASRLGNALISAQEIVKEAEESVVVAQMTLDGLGGGGCGRGRGRGGGAGGGEAGRTGSARPSRNLRARGSTGSDIASAIREKHAPSDRSEKGMWERESEAGGRSSVMGSDTPNRSDSVTNGGGAGGAEEGKSDGGTGGNDAGGVGPGAGGEGGAVLSSNDEEFADADADGDGMISKDEWRRWMEEKRAMIQAHNRDREQLIRENRRLRQALNPKAESTERQMRLLQEEVSQLEQELEGSNSLNSKLQVELTSTFKQLEEASQTKEEMETSYQMEMQEQNNVIADLRLRCSVLEQHILAQQMEQEQMQNLMQQQAAGGAGDELMSPEQLAQVLAQTGGGGAGAGGAGYTATDGGPGGGGGRDPFDGELGGLDDFGIGEDIQDIGHGGGGDGARTTHRGRTGSPSRSGTGGPSGSRRARTSSRSQSPDRSPTKSGWAKAAIARDMRKQRG